MAETADEIGRRQGHRPLIATDNTMLGPVYQNPLTCGADLNIYSLQGQLEAPDAVNDLLISLALEASWTR